MFSLLPVLPENIVAARDPQSSRQSEKCILVIKQIKERMNYKQTVRCNSYRSRIFTNVKAMVIVDYKWPKPVVVGLTVSPSANSAEESSMSPPVPAATAALNLARFVLKIMNLKIKITPIQATNEGHQTLAI